MLVFNESWSSGLERNCRYQRVVNPLRGNVGSSESLNEKMSSTTIGA